MNPAVSAFLVAFILFSSRLCAREWIGVKNGNIQETITAGEYSVKREAHVDKSRDSFLPSAPPPANPLGTSRDYDWKGGYLEERNYRDISGISVIRSIGDYYHVYAGCSDLDALSLKFATYQDAQDFKQYVEKILSQLKNGSAEPAEESSAHVSQPPQTPPTPPPPPYQPPSRLSDLTKGLQLTLVTPQRNREVTAIDDLISVSLKKNDYLGENIDELLAGLKGSGLKPLDNYPEPKIQGEKGEWREKSGLKISAWGSEFLFLNANVWVVVCNEKGEAKFSGPYLKIVNNGKKPFYYSSHMAGQESNLPIQPGETYMKRIEIYRDNAHKNDDLDVDLRAVYWHETP